MKRTVSVVFIAIIIFTVVPPIIQGVDSSDSLQNIVKDVTSVEFLSTLGDGPQPVEVRLASGETYGSFLRVERDIGSIDASYIGNGFVHVMLTLNQAKWLLHSGTISFMGEKPRDNETPPTWYGQMDCGVYDLLYDHQLDGEGVTIAIVGGGVNHDHPALDSTVEVVVDCSTNPVTVYDPPPSTPIYLSTHDTPMSTIVAGDGDDGTGGTNLNLYGVATRASLIVVVTNGASANQRGIDWIKNNAATYGIDLALMYAGSYITSPQVYGGSWITRADELWTQAGVAVVAPIGNNKYDYGWSPAQAQHALAVGAYKDTHRGGPEYIDWTYMNPWTNYPYTLLKKPQVLAPGWALTAGSANYPTVLTCSVSGTCPAAAFVTGICALLLQDDPSLKNDADSDGLPDVFDLLMASSLVMEGFTDNPGPDTKMGFGKAHADRAYDMLHADYSSSKYNAPTLDDIGSYDESLWGKDKDDWYKRYLYAGQGIVITIDCDPDLAVKFYAYRYSTYITSRTIGLGASKIISITASSSGWYYFNVKLHQQYSFSFSGDYYDFDWVWQS